MTGGAFCLLTPRQNCAKIRLREVQAGFALVSQPPGPLG
jgi:hypothetical protein